MPGSVGPARSGQRIGPDRRIAWESWHSRRPPDQSRPGRARLHLTQQARAASQNPVGTSGTSFPPLARAAPPAIHVREARGRRRVPPKSPITSPQTRRGSAWHSAGFSHATRRRGARSNSLIGKRRKSSAARRRGNDSNTARTYSKLGRQVRQPPSTSRWQRPDRMSGLEAQVNRRPSSNRWISCEQHRTSRAGLGCSSPRTSRIQLYRAPGSALHF
jgi:hypothetical protein